MYYWWAILLLFFFEKNAFNNFLLVDQEQARGNWFENSFNDLDRIICLFFPCFYCYSFNKRIYMYIYILVAWQWVDFDQRSLSTEATGEIHGRWEQVPRSARRSDGARRTVEFGSRQERTDIARRVNAYETRKSQSMIYFYFFLFLANSLAL